MDPTGDPDKWSEASTSATKVPNSIWYGASPSWDIISRLEGVRALDPYLQKKLKAVCHNSIKAAVFHDRTESR